MLIVFVGKIVSRWLNKHYDGLKVEEQGQHRNPVTRKTACDSQELILLIAQSYLITVCSQGILSLNETCYSAKQVRRSHIAARRIS